MYKWYSTVMLNTCILNKQYTVMDTVIYLNFTIVGKVVVLKRNELATSYETSFKIKTILLSTH